MDKMIALLMWLLPIFFCLHVAEEFFLPGGFIEWYHSLRPKYARTKASWYFWVNAIPIAATFMIPISHKGPDMYHMDLIVCGWLSSNAIFTHLRGMIKTKRYSPGAFVGGVLILPLSIYSYIYFIQNGVVDILTAISCAALCPLLEMIFATVKKPSRKDRQPEGAI